MLDLQRDVTAQSSVLLFMQDRRVITIYSIFFVEFILPSDRKYIFIPVSFYVVIQTRKLVPPKKLRLF